jgi:two-component system, OmpR family, sensor histidine kinase TctE
MMPAMMRDRSLRGHLLRLLLLPVAGILAVSSIAAYYLALDPATEAHDASLTDAGLALAERIRSSGGVTTLDLPVAAEQVLRTDKYDKIYYLVRDPAGRPIAGDAGIPLPPGEARPQGGSVFYEAIFREDKVRATTLRAPCAGEICTIIVAETMHKRDRLVKEILLGSVLPQALLAILTLVIVWFGVARGLDPLRRLSDEIRTRSARDLRPIEPAHVPEEAQPLIAALNQLLIQVQESNRNQQRFVANAAHQLRTPLAGLRAHAELALAQPLVDAARAEVSQVHSATVRTARLANQLLALARAEPGGRIEPASSPVDLKRVVEGAADEWVHRALERDVDLGFELDGATVQGDILLLREALGNLVHNALEYVARGGHVTVRTGMRADAWNSGEPHPFVEVEDDGPGIPPAERARVVERFYRVPGTHGTGSGLGLAIVNEIAATHRATLEISEGASGKGCRVELKFV